MKLGPVQERLYAVFKDRPNEDIAIAHMYAATYAVSFAELIEVSIRDMQQRLAPVIARLNGNLPPNNRVEPGQLKRTYRLNTDV